MTTIVVKRRLREPAVDGMSAKVSRLGARPRPGTSALGDLVRVLALEQFERDLFRGESRDIGMPQVFGGQVLSQALTAAYATVRDRAVHSLHAYFLRRGDVKAPIVYQVERTRDGSSFSSRRVIATQHGEQILNLSASFQIPEQGFEHHLEMPRVPPPESLADECMLVRDARDHLSERVAYLLLREKPFEFRFVQSPFLGPFLGLPQGRAPLQQFWFRAIGPVPDDPTLHHCLLTYVSDYHLLVTATAPHGAAYGEQIPIVASIDHSLWFHRSVRVDEWLLYSMESPSASGARGFARASIFDRDGQLVASTAQEGLIRAHAARRRSA